MDSQYETLSPWAEADPIPSSGISPRLTELTGKRIGLFINGKIASRPTQTFVEQRLKDSFTAVEFSHFVHITNESVAEAKDRPAYEEWLTGVDAVILAVGD